MKHPILKTNGLHIGLPGDRAAYNPQAETTSPLGRYTIVVMLRCDPEDDTADSLAYTDRATADQVADDCERYLRRLIDLDAGSAFQTIPRSEMEG